MSIGFDVRSKYHSFFFADYSEKKKGISECTHKSIGDSKANGYHLTNANASGIRRRPANCSRCKYVKLRVFIGE
ncbi:hypothetical protein I7I50_00462 [Histoplasma capsulatum G186AR]|uniref:Uncharacterized protein n=1 Tax=Ajellomyces capsulatus TaxID=5037 RepID=A0A8H7YFQ3_AJECA|nr:hypothetical protein I7I52_07730 [Histoplasma capsulatum]QSS72575.1 hypothetical protein I7I50_00462 [Histoplasma capsulatum G186AR]